MSILKKLNIQPFQPPFWLKHPLAQTIIPYYLPYKEAQPPINRINVPLEDGDQLNIALSKPDSWKTGQRIVVLFHGLAGCEDSKYLVRMNKKFFDRGYLTIRVNLRACGPGKGLAKNPYHSGRSEDARAVLHWIESNYPESLITQIGFSLSANITLKMLGEDDNSISSQLDSAIAVSPPLNLAGSAEKMVKDNFRIFNYFFLKKLKKHAQEIASDFPAHKPIQWPKKMDLIDFDDLYTAPRSGFKNAQHYYDSSSSLQFIPNIKRKTLILLSLDDPVVVTQGLDKIQLPECIDLVETQKGGHVGFFEGNNSWMDQLLIKWVQSQK